MSYTLMDTHSGNIVGSHPDKESALRAVTEAVERYGEDAAATLALGKFAPGQPGELIAEGPGLVKLAATDKAATSANGPHAAEHTRRPIRKK